MKPLSFLLTAAGFICVAIGGAALFVPLVPTTPFLLLGGFCLARGSERHYAWLCEQSWYQEYVAGYTNGRGIPLRAKVITLSSLWLAIIASAVFFAPSIWVQLPMLLIATIITALLLRIKTCAA